jgi:hypothetical protein
MLHSEGFRRGGFFASAVFTCIVIIASSGFAGGVYSGGNGFSPATAFQISRAADWVELMNTPIDWAGTYFVLTNDINLIGVTITPVGSESMPFHAVLNGNGFCLCNASLERVGKDYMGLFGYIGGSGRVSNLSVTNGKFKAGHYVGILAAVNNGWIDFCNTTGLVEAIGHVGGLVGINSGTISSSHSTAKVSGTIVAGGLAGYNNAGTILSSYATGDVTGRDYIGGLAGHQYSGIIMASYATGNVCGNSSVGGLVGLGLTGTIRSSDARGNVEGIENVGGLVGYNYSITYECFAKGQVSGSFRIGGLSGYNFGFLDSCYASGAVNGKYFEVGGLVGANGGNLRNCYARGAVCGGTTKTGGLVGSHFDGTIDSCYATGAVTGSTVGGLVGTYSTSPTAFSRCFWDIETSGIAVSQLPGPRAQGKTTAQMQDQATFENAGWDFARVWTICSGCYPQLQWQVPIGDLLCPAGLDVNDLVLLSQWWLTQDCDQQNDCDGADLDNSNTVDLEDFAIFAASWMNSLD